MTCRCHELVTRSKSLARMTEVIRDAYITIKQKISVFFGSLVPINVLDDSESDCVYEY